MCNLFGFFCVHHTTSFRQLLCYSTSLCCYRVESFSGEATRGRQPGGNVRKQQGQKRLASEAREVVRAVKSLTDSQGNQGYLTMLGDSTVVLSLWNYCSSKHLSFAVGAYILFYRITSTLYGVQVTNCYQINKT